MYRQGDVLLIPANDLSASHEVPRENGRIVLAHGEATGHAHAIEEPRARLFEEPKSGRRLLRLVTESFLRHEEHAPITLPPGDYEVIRQREYTPEEIRRVAD